MVQCVLIIPIQTVNDFIRSSFDIILEADEFNFNTNTGKLILCIPYHYNDPTSIECEKSIEHITANKLWIDVRIHFSK